MLSVTPTIDTVRRRWQIRGQVQGVGFRPFVCRVAREMGLGGYVRNDSSSVVIEAQGSDRALEEFVDRVQRDLPPMARIDQIESERIAPGMADAFVIAGSSTDQDRRPVIPADIAVCRECLAEMRDARDFRHGYPLINCTNCGPRYSIIRHMPYDRAQTTMRSFVLCEKCHQQYANIVDRRFHAQPVACGDCGPRVGLRDSDSGATQWQHAISEAARRIAAGAIIAIKGIGGFHLACRADDPVVVAELRRRKGRDAKPFAVMCADVQVARQLVDLGDEALAVLTSPAAPIVLAPAKWLPAEQMNALAPHNYRMGVVLPYTPLHHALFDALQSVKTLVMTSANLSDEPLVKDNDEAVARLSGIADAILLHERDIERSVDDSVVLDMGSGEPPLPIRRARGYVPQVVKLRHTGRATCGLCVGGELKNTVAVVRGDEVILSHHLGDLKHTLAYDYFRRAIDDLCGLLEVRPDWIAHDLHPAYLSTQWAKHLGKMWSVPIYSVQHHHAHAAAVLAEHGVTERALALVCDGVGYGLDGTAWGGELLEIDGAGFRRLAHLRPITLPGGDAAARETRRCAAAVLHELGESVEHVIHDETERAVVETMLATGHNSIRSSAAGRLFDAVAGLLGVCDRNTHEAQAAMCLESLAMSVRGASYSGKRQWHVTERDGVLVLGLLGYVASLSGRKNVARAAWDFHEVFSRAWADVVVHVADQRQLRVVGLSGGVFCNQIITSRITELLSAAGLHVVRHEVVPPNDGGIAFGQAAVVRAMQAR